MHTTTYASMQKYNSPFAPKASGVEVGGRTHTNLVAAGWITTMTWDVDSTTNPNGTTHSRIYNVQHHAA